MKDKSIIKETVETVSDNTEKVIEQLKDGLKKIGDIGTSVKDSFVNYVKDVFDVLPLIEKAGFRTNRLIVGISLPPSIEIHFSRFKEISEVELEELYEEYSDKAMFSMILKALVMSNKFQSKLSLNDLVFSETCIEISIPPKVSIKYLNKNIADLNSVEAQFD